VDLTGLKDGDCCGLAAIQGQFGLVGIRADEDALDVEGRGDEEARTALENKVDKEEGKGLSENDYTDEDKAIVDGVTTALNGKVDKDGDKVLSDNNYSDEDKAIVVNTPTALDGKADKSNTYTKTETNTLLSAKANTSDLSTVATSGDYDDLTNKPELSEVATSGSYDDLTDKPTIDNEIKSDSTNAVENKAIYDFLNNLLPEATETGNPISITNASGLNAKSLKVELEPIQDLNGYDSPWVGGGGKNKLPLILSDIKTINTSGTWTGNTYVLNGITYEVQTDTNGNITGIKATGTASANANFRVYQTDNPTNTQVDFFANKILNGCPTNGTTSTYFEYIQIGTSTTLGRDLGSEYSTPVDMSGYYGVTQVYVGVSVRNGFECPTGGLLFKPMLRLSTEADGTFAPYSNICPISGRTQTVVSVNSEDTTIPFNQTVYGGEVDVTSGGTSNKFGFVNSFQRINIDSSGKLWKIAILSSIAPISGDYYTKCLCNMYKCVALQTCRDNTVLGIESICVYGNGIFISGFIGRENELDSLLPNLQVAYIFDTSTTINTPAFDIPLNKGDNTLTADGDMELVYSKTPQ
jgi:hypothetical protein